MTKHTLLDVQCGVNMGCRSCHAQADVAYILCPEHQNLSQAAPDLLAALEAAFVQTDDDVFYRTAGGISQDVPERIARKVRLAFAKVKKGKTT